MSAKLSIRHALSLSFLQKAVSLVFSFGSVVIVSHLLTPSEIGIFSIAAGVMAIIQVLRDFGVTEFLVQERDIDKPLIQTVFTINLVIAWSLGLLLFGISEPMGRFYDHTGVTSVLRVLSLVLVVLPFGTTAMALMKREIAFTRLSKINISATVIRSCSVVGLAYAGFSYMSMAWGSLIGVAATVAGCLVWGWSYRVRGIGLSEWRRVLHFGATLTISDIAGQLGSQSANLIIGKVLGTADVGLYSRGYGIVNMYRTNVVGAIDAVAFPAFAAEHRETGRSRELFVRATSYLTGISWPFFACGAILAKPIMLIVFGDQWLAAVPVMRWLCLASIVGTLTYQCGEFLVAIGRVRTFAKLTVVYQVVRVAITLAAAFEGLVAAAAAQILVYVFGVSLYYGILRRNRLLRLREVVRAIAPSGALMLATCVVPAVVMVWPGMLESHRVLGLAIAVAGGCATWLVTVLGIRHPLAQELRKVVRAIVDRAGGMLHPEQKRAE